VNSVSGAARGDTWRGLYASGLLGRFAVLCLGVWLHAVDILVTATISPGIVDDIGGVAYINWTLMLYETGTIVTAAAAPSLSQRIGIKGVLQLAALLYGGGCLIAAFAPHMGVLLAGRLAQGLGGGLLLSLCYLAVQQWFPQSWWSRLFGIVAVIWGAGSLLGPLIGGMFAGLHAWRMTFVAFAVQAAGLWIMTSLWLPSESPASGAAQRLPFLPLGVLLSGTLLIAESSVAGDIAASAIAAPSGLGLIYQAARLDRRSGSRLFPAQLLEFGHPVSAGLWMVLALSTASVGFWAYGPLVLKILFGTPPLATGYILAGEAVAWSLATLAVTRAPVSADRRLIRVGVTMAAAGAGGFALAVPSGAMAAIVLCALLEGGGFGLCWPTIVHRMTRLADVADQPVAVASPETVSRIGYAVGSAAVGIAANLSGLAAGVSIGAAKSAAFWVFAAFVPLLFVALLCAWRFTRNAAGMRG
jgi:MFS family permease